MRRILTVAALGLLVCGAAQAQYRGNHGGGYGAPAYQGGYHGGGWVAPLVMGAIAGAVMNSVVAPPPVVYAQPVCNVVVTGYDYYRNPIYTQVCQ